MPTNYRPLDDQEKEAFRIGHLPHRLTLLRTFRDRQAENWQGKGDIYRCVKDSALISMRLFLDAMGLQGQYDETKGEYILRVNKKERRGDDVWIDQLGGTLVDPDSISDDERRILAGIYKRADKELAHLTVSDVGEFNTPAVIIRGIDTVERLIRTNLYDKVGWAWPPRTT
jgi:hypothetical protein